MKNQTNLPVAIIGGGPIGLAAAAHLSKRGRSFIIYEAGEAIAENIRSWQHVPMFSPWKYNLDSASVEILSRQGWNKPGSNKIPTGKELIEEYLIPLSKSPEIAPYIRLNAKVINISRKRMSKMKSFGRDTGPFTLHIECDNHLEVVNASAVIDASGTWMNQNPIGADGLPAQGELDNQSQIFYGIPEVLGKHMQRYKHKSIAVVGGGHSAINALLELAELKKRSHDIQLTWILRKASVQSAYGGLGDDELPGRGKVGERVKELVESGQVEVLTPFFVEEISKVENNKLIIRGQSPEGEQFVAVDEIISATGLKPDIDMLRELRISLDAVVESPVMLAPLIDPNVHSCGSVEPHGEAELRHPEKDFYIVGMKSYGRAPTFLLATGYEQVRSVVAGLVGDWEAARRVQLDLPETGICGVPEAVDPNTIATIESVSPCCNEPPEIDCCTTPSEATTLNKVEENEY